MYIMLLPVKYLNGLFGIRKLDTTVIFIVSFARWVDCLIPLTYTPLSFFHHSGFNIKNGNQTLFATNSFHAIVGTAIG